MMTRIPVLILAILCLLSPPLYAAKLHHPYEIKKSNYFKKPYGYFRAKEREEAGLSGGLKKLFLGWTEIISEPIRAASNGDNIASGTARGLRNGIVETIDGLFQTVSLGKIGHS